MTYEEALTSKGFSVKRNYCSVCGGRKLTTIVFKRGSDVITVWPNKHTYRHTTPVLLRTKGSTHELAEMVQSTF